MAEPTRQVTQTITYSPENEAQGVYGNCVQAAVASFLDMPLEAVPHVVLFADWTAALEFWARGVGYTLKAKPVEAIPAEGRFLLSARSPRGVMHFVVVEDGKVAWDPHPSRAGVTDEVRAVYWFEPWSGGGGCPVCRTDAPPRSGPHERRQQRMSSAEIVTATTHELAAALLRRPDVRFRSLVWGRLSIVWDDRRPAPVPTEDSAPREDEP